MNNKTIMIEDFAIFTTIRFKGYSLRHPFSLAWSIRCCSFISSFSIPWRCKVHKINIKLQYFAIKNYETITYELCGIFQLKIIKRSQGQRKLLEMSLTKMNNVISKHQKSNKNACILVSILDIDIKFIY